MKFRPLLAAFAIPAASLAAADPAPGGPERLTELWESNGSRREFLESLRLIKQAGPRNGAVRVFEALIALSDGRALEASEYAALAAAAPSFDFGDREGVERAIEAGLPPPVPQLRNLSCAELVEFLVCWGEEWDWRGKHAKAREAWRSAATLAARFEAGAPRVEWALRWSNLRYRAHHRLAGLALRAGDEEQFREECALGAAAHATRTALAAAPEPACAEEWRTAVESGYGALLPTPVEPPDHALAALADAPDLFGVRSPAALTVVALENRFRDRALPTRYDAALALLPHAAAVRDALRTWSQTAAEPAVGWALRAAAAERVAVPEESLEDPWAARACDDENALERAFERLPRVRRVAVAFRLMDLRKDDDVDLGR